MAFDEKCHLVHNYSGSHIKLYRTCCKSHASDLLYCKVYLIGTALVFAEIIFLKYFLYLY
jgi:hypothetical protein